MSNNDNNIPPWILNSLCDLFVTDRILFSRSIKEECINCAFVRHLYNNIVPELDGYFIDIEFDKMITENNTNTKKIQYNNAIRPDILIHRRTKNLNENYAVIECKKGYLNSNDKSKLLEFSKTNFCYKFCLGISYLIHKSYWRLYVVLDNKILPYNFPKHKI
jgi:hypothetical protein